MDSLVKNGRVERGLLGVTTQNLAPDLAQAFKLNRAAGALVGDVSSGSPADKGGLKSGDVITQFNGQPIQDANQLKLRVAETAPGSKVPVVVDRNGQDKTFDVTLAARLRARLRKRMRRIMGVSERKLLQESESLISLKTPDQS
jgi:serine protease Do